MSFFECVGEPYIVTWDFFVAELIDTRSSLVPDSVIYNGEEKRLRAMLFEKIPIDLMRRLRVYFLRHDCVSPPPPEIVCLRDFQVFCASESLDGPSFTTGGHSFQWGIGEKERYSYPQRFGGYVEYWSHCVYAGRHLFCRVSARDEEHTDYRVGDIVVRMYSSENFQDHSANQQLAALFPLPLIQESFVSERVYQSSDYSLYAEEYHGPMADQVGAQWTGHMTVPCDGAGLFASRYFDRAYCSDLASGPWVHESVHCESMTDTLRKTPEGSLQVLFFCLAFLNESDYQYIRHPYLIVDRYRYKKSSVYQTDHVSSSVYFDVTMSEPLRVKNPPFTKNLVLRKEASFFSDHLVSQYARQVGLSDTGPKITQVWSELLSQPDNYSAMVGMIPIFEDFDLAKRKYTRIIYSTHGEKPTGIPYCREGEKWYFYFPVPTTYSYPELGIVYEFPNVRALDYVGRTIKDLESDYGPRISDRLLTSFKSQYVRLYKGIFCDFSELKELIDLDIERPFVLSGSLAKKLSKYVQPKGKGKFVLKNAVNVSDDKTYSVFSQYGVVCSCRGEKPTWDVMRTRYGPGRWCGSEWQIWSQVLITNKWSLTSPRTVLPFGNHTLRVSSGVKEVVLLADTPLFQVF